MLWYLVDWLNKIKIYKVNIYYNPENIIVIIYLDYSGFENFLMLKH